MAETESLERDDIQGIVFSGYVHLRRVAYLLLSIGGTAADARAWLGRVAGDVTSARKMDKDKSLNIALTFTGLKKLGLDGATLATFPIAFSEGMASARRASILSDDKSNAASAWDWGGPARPVDVMLMVFAKTQEELDPRRDQLLADAKNHGVTPVAVLHAELYDDRNEHFGFSDGVAQPVLASQRKPEDAATAADAGNVVSDGEFVLGYTNAYGFDSEAPQLGPDKSLGKNGTYLVFRQTTQDVAGLWKFVDAAADHDDAQREKLAAKMVGRWKSGAPLADYPDEDPDPLEKLPPKVNFSFENDRKGLACPFGAHVRRSNPRDGLLNSSNSAESFHRAARHRLLRRGRSYGPKLVKPLEDDGKTNERGLHFICLCADIERQFEFVQQTWINNPLFGQLVGEVDPLVGDQTAGEGWFTVQREPVRERLGGMACFVALKGGAYFFLPSIRALRWLGST